MLTPGEFVINKEASAMYGPLLEKINNTGLQQRHTENQQVVSRNTGGPLMGGYNTGGLVGFCLLYTSPSPRDRQKSRMPSSA